MAGIKALRKIQLGAEATRGTAVAATTMWRGQGVIEDRREVVFVDEDVGFISGMDRTITPRLLAAIEFEEAPATFEQLPYILAAGVDGVTTGTADGTGSGKIYTYTFPTTARKNIQTYTIEAGDDQRAEEMEYAFVESFALSGEAGDLLNVSASWLGRQATPTTFTSGVALPSVEDIPFSLGKLYIDDAGGTIGTTQKSNTLVAATLSVTTGWKPVFTADGAKTFNHIQMDGSALEVTLEITFLHDGTAAAEIDNWRNEVARLIRLMWEGSDLATPGTNYSKKTLIVDLAGRWERFEKLDERDGNDVVTGLFRARYNPTAAKFAEIVVVNELTSLP